MSEFHTFGGGTYTLNSSISSTATSITLTSFTEPVSGVVYTMALLDTDIAYGTIAPRTTSSEFISFTGITANADGTATLTGVTRGLAKKSPFTGSATFRLPHAGQSQFIISDVPQVFEQYPVKASDETITGQWTFSTFPITPSNSDASTTVKGVTKLSVAPASATAPIALGTNDDRALVGYAADSVGTDAYAITPSPAITAYSTGQVFTFKAGTANTGAATLAVSGLSAIAIKKNVSDALVTGDILANQLVMVEYDGTNMQLISVPSGIVSNITTPVIRTYTSSDTWTKPTGLKYIIVEVVGGGGGGAGNTTANTTSGGGGGGGYSKELLAASALGATETYAVGAAGAAGASSGGTGGTGGTSSFGTSPFLQATGGVGGTFDPHTGGAGGVGSSGILNVAGGGGGAGGNAATGPAGAGGSSVYGGGAPGRGSAEAAGIAGGNYGGGGGGAYNTSGADTAGGAGAAGVVIVTEYYA